MWRVSEKIKINLLDKGKRLVILFLILKQIKENGEAENASL